MSTLFLLYIHEDDQDIFEGWGRGLYPTREKAEAARKKYLDECDEQDRYWAEDNLYIEEVPVIDAEET
jgi:hypothetical protein